MKASAERPVWRRSEHRAGVLQPDADAASQGHVAHVPGVLAAVLALGADISIMALTKYLSGHSDVLMGSVCTREAAWPALASILINLT